MKLEDEYEDNGRSWEFNRVKNMPLTLKAAEVLYLVTKICELIHHHDYEDSRILHESCDFMKSNAMMIKAKIHGAEAVDYYDLKMENAAIIRKAAIEILQDCRTLQIYGFDEEAYLNLVRIAIGEFRELFLEWIAHFDRNTWIGDEWGLFNPPGVSEDDLRKNLEDED